MDRESGFPELRLRLGNDHPVNRRGDYVLYWMVANRRLQWNFSLQRARDWARELNRPLVVFEALRCDYRWASDRLHAFIVQGMVDNARTAATLPITYWPYVEPEARAGQGLLAAWAKEACVVISDDFPCFFLPTMAKAAARQIPTRFELVDSNGLLPMRAAPKIFQRAYDFRRFLQKSLLPHLAELPEESPIDEGTSLPRLGDIPSSVGQHWQPTDIQSLVAQRDGWSRFPLDHTVRPVSTRGGTESASRAWREFLARRLPLYAERRNQPEENVASGLSPYLHFGHVSVHQLFSELTRAEKWTPKRVAASATGSSSGWWGTSEAAESFLDELITWRELGYNLCWQSPDYDQYSSLPDWARATLRKHANDRREAVYSLDQFAAAKTHDPLWNAAQRQLTREGTIHNYLRMLWGKKILQWSASPEDALDVMIELNNRFALDGRNPNSYSGIFWVLGRYDRPWAPERPVFGTIRYMSSENTARKVRVKEYLRQYGEQPAQRGLAFEP